MHPEGLTANSKERPARAQLIAVLANSGSSQQNATRSQEFSRHELPSDIEMSIMRLGAAQSPLSSAVSIAIGDQVQNSTT